MAIITKHASNLNGTTIEILSYELANYAGASLHVVDEPLENKWIIELLSKAGNNISSIEIHYDTIIKESIDKFELDYSNKKLNFILKDGTTLSCDLSEIIDNIIALDESLKDEIKRAKAVEEELLKLIAALNFGPKGAPGSYLSKISQTVGKIACEITAFDNIIDETATHENAPTTLAVKDSIDLEAEIRSAEDLKIDTKLEAEIGRSQAKETELNNKIEQEKTERLESEATLGERITNIEEDYLTSADKAELNANLNKEIADRQSGKILGDFAEGIPYHLPYFFTTRPDGTKVSVDAYTISLDGNKTKEIYSLDVKAATEELAGLMSADDAKKLRNDLPTAIKEEATTRKAADDDLNERLNNLSAKGRFLAVWNAETGLPATYPTIEVGADYEYHTGDYYIVGTVGTENKRPAGTKITRTGETTWDIPVEAESISVNTGAYYIFDTNIWTLVNSASKEVTFEQIAGKVEDNIKLKQAFDDTVSKAHAYTDREVAKKQDKLTAGDNIEISEANVISATDTKYTAGTGISINENIISKDFPEITIDPSQVVDPLAWPVRFNLTEEQYAIVEDIKNDSIWVNPIKVPEYEWTTGLKTLYHRNVLSKTEASWQFTAIDDQNVLYTITCVRKGYPEEKVAIYKAEKLQHKLTAGDNIEITSGLTKWDAELTISAKDTTYTAGENIEISEDNVISAIATKNYNDLDNIPIENKCLDDTTNELVLNACYRHIEGEKKEGTKFETGNALAPIYFDTTQAPDISGITSWLGEYAIILTDNIVNAIAIQKLDELGEEYTGEFVLCALVSEITDILYCSKEYSYEDPETGKTITVKQGWQNLDHSKYTPIIIPEETQNVIVDSNIYKNRIWLSKTPIVSQYDNGVLYKCINTETPTFSKLAAVSDLTPLETSITTEITARKAADVTLQTNIDTEATTRNDADIILQANIDAEISNRVNADTALSARIDTKQDIITAATDADIDALFN